MRKIIAVLSIGLFFVGCNNTGMTEQENEALKKYSDSLNNSLVMTINDSIISDGGDTLTDPIGNAAKKFYKTTDSIIANNH